MEKRITEIILGCCALTENITKNSKIKELSLDSLSFVQIIVNLEREFCIEFDDEKLNINLYTTVGELMEAVEETVNAEY